MRISGVLAGVLLALAFTANAKDLGVHGTVYSITEIDIRELIMREADKVDWQAVQDGMVDRAKTYVERLPQNDKPWPDRTHVRWVDPTVVLDRDIVGPMPDPNTGDIADQVIVPKGTRVNILLNPLYRLPQAMLLFNGSDEDQVKLVEGMLKERGLYLVPVALSGNPNKLSERVSRPVFYGDAKTLPPYWNITHSPSLVFVGEGENHKNFGVLAFARGTTVKKALSLWDSYTKDQRRKP